MARGDAAPDRAYYLHLRAAELVITGAAAAADRAEASTWVRRARGHIEHASRVLASTDPCRRGDAGVTLLKVKLRAAMVLTADDQARGLVEHLARLGVPISRMPVALARPGGPLPPLTARVRRLLDDLTDAANCRIRTSTPSRPEPAHASL